MNVWNKKIYIIVFVALSIFIFTSAAISECSAPDIEWARSYGGTEVDQAYAIQQTTDGGYIVAGISKSNDGDVSGNHDKEDFWIIKLDAKGDIVWQKSLGGSGNDRTSSIRQTADGGYIAAGTSDSNDGDALGNYGSLDGWVVKLDGNGELVWQRMFGGTMTDWIKDIQQTIDGGYIFTGTTFSRDSFMLKHPRYIANVWVVKLNAEGQIVWQRVFGGSKIDEGRAVQQTKDGGYVIAAYNTSSDGGIPKSHGEWDYWIIKLDAEGSVTWQKTFGGSKFEVANSIQETDEGYIVEGFSDSTDGDVSGNYGSSDYWIVKLDTKGNIDWQRSLGGKDKEISAGIQQTKDGGYIIGGWSESNDGDVSGNHGKGDYWIIKLDARGDIVWQKSLGGSGTDRLNSIQQTADGGYIVAGSSESNDGDVSGNHGASDFWIVKLKPEL